MGFLKIIVTFSIISVIFCQSNVTTSSSMETINSTSTESLNNTMNSSSTASNKPMEATMRVNVSSSSKSIMNTAVAGNINSTDISPSGSSNNSMSSTVAKGNMAKESMPPPKSQASPLMNSITPSESEKSPIETHKATPSLSKEITHESRSTKEGVASSPSEPQASKSIEQTKKVISPSASKKTYPSSVVNNITPKLTDTCKDICCGNSLANTFNVTALCEDSVSKDLCDHVVMNKNITLTRPCDDCKCTGTALVASMTLLLMAFASLYQNM